MSGVEGSGWDGGRRTSCLGSLQGLGDLGHLGFGTWMPSLQQYDGRSADLRVVLVGVYVETEVDMFISRTEEKIDRCV